MSRVYVTGAARSGTKYLADVLTELGVHATHERATFEAGDGGGFVPDFSDAGAVEVSSDGVYRIRDLAQLTGMEAIGHVIRHPQAVVASLTGRTLWDDPWGQRRAYEWPALGVIDLSPIDRSLLYWITVNQWIDQMVTDVPVVQFDLAKPAGALRVIAQIAGVQLEGNYARRVIAEFPTDVNHREDQPPVTYAWSDHDPWLRHIAEVMTEGYGLEGDFR